ncbi:hypothetical protein [Micromonospora sp. NBS 11-29]|uniref:hypothetical protein n=1 Tax=Micromonospora sp. NBS 11-29 TaxID=1960879 RepID=UPI001C39232A|nr:hypothetical protein [Micromonospora sp. NBS 11-29]
MCAQVSLPAASCLACLLGPAARLSLPVRRDAAHFAFHIDPLQVAEVAVWDAMRWHHIGDGVWINAGGIMDATSPCGRQPG